MASNILDCTSCGNLFVAFAAVTGFAELKSRRGLEYVFVVEVFWSDKRTTYIKRTYKDFLRFYRLLFNKLKTKAADPDTGWRRIPRLEGRKWFRRNNRGLAEIRELELHHFVGDLLRIHPQVASDPVVVDFFEQRPTDPCPYKEPCYDIDEDLFSNIPINS
ncbi:SH3 and PX domain-containing protein 2A-like [Gigantopelta aegis]|uniref:SH3 and PX domain-containing protein 2A-like n=1 Tax=Gigantopelta aegis TaxID=1735272 RepID=UPI001B88C8C8|nr:SH3 and PX domain-containing protein 2A-like [Gigantopelta aegis]XP_041377143.1 SH3 and PX domain-containing protein 2A-like [Gigantopelta aegis]